MRMKYAYPTCLIIAAFIIAGCSDAGDQAMAENPATQPSEPLTMAETSNTETDYPVQKSEDEWRKELSEDEYYILREAGTEAPFTGQYVNEKTPGVYTCVGCGNELFDSGTKFDSGTGWPSFYDVLDKGKVELKKDTSAGMTRTEVVCARCGGHLGHLFEDAKDQPTGLRYCINSAALDLEPKQKSDE